MKAFFTFSLLLTLQAISMAYASPAPLDKTIEERGQAKSCTSVVPLLGQWENAHSNLATPVVLRASIRDMTENRAHILDDAAYDQFDYQRYISNGSTAAIERIKRPAVVAVGHYLKHYERGKSTMSFFA
ncbi:hypothetical protein JOM56_005488 [Amanita muscaria]